jgi:hypothetical protein
MLAFLRGLPTAARRSVAAALMYFSSLQITSFDLITSNVPIRSNEISFTPSGSY